MRKVIFSLLIITLVAFPLFSSCTGEQGSDTPTATPAATASTSTPAATGEWWDKFGEPEYGGTITLPYSGLANVQFDIYTLVGADYGFWLESTFSTVNWTLDRSNWTYTTMYTPEPYMVGVLVESWERPDLETVIFHIRQGVHWQDKAPVNGREFTAYDVVEHYDRLMGTGSGYTEPAPFYMGGFTPNWGKFTALDDYTVEFKFTQDMGSIGMATLMDSMSLNAIEAPEWVDQGDLQNWRTVVGTGPWMLTDYLEGTSMTFSKNPNYWGYDERHPENQLPYADTFKILFINDTATELAAFRSGQIDVLTDLSREQLGPLQKSNSDLEYIYVPGMANGVVPRVDMAPFGDIRVRKALQLSINLEDIAKKLDTEATPVGIVSPALMGCNYPYEEWPQDLKDEYGYNPEKAKELLAEAAADGVFVPNADGGFDTNLVLSSQYDPEIFEIIKSYFANVGVNMDIEVMDMVAARSFIGAGKHDQFSAGSLAMSQSFNALLNRFKSTNTDLNTGWVKDDIFDSYVEELNSATTYDEMAEVMRKADKRIIEQHWHISTVPNDTLCVWQPYLKGYSGEQMLRWYTGGWVFARLWLGE